MAHHELKTDPEQYQAVEDGVKHFEIRFNDRDYQPCDTLTLKETRYTSKEMHDINDPKPLEYTGRELGVMVDYVLHGNQYGVLPGFAILSI